MPKFVDDIDSIRIILPDRQNFPGTGHELQTSRNIIKRFTFECQWPIVSFTLALFYLKYY